MLFHCRCVLATTAAALIATLAYAADVQYKAELDSVPHDNSTRANLVGQAQVGADLSGNRLTLHGSFSGLSSSATGAHVMAGLATGVPGTKIADLTVASADSGEISGSLSLSREQVSELKAGRLYVQLDSTKAPDGTLWGWLLPTASE